MAYTPSNGDFVRKVNSTQWVPVNDSGLLRNIADGETWELIEVSETESVVLARRLKDGLLYRGLGRFHTIFAELPKLVV